jgi:hypothetical protein
MLTRFLCTGLLSAAICSSSFSTTRSVPTATYPTLLSAYNASSNGDVISITGAISSAGFTISKRVIIQSSSSTALRQITLTSTTPFTVNYSTVTFTRAKIVGVYNGTCIKINSGKCLCLYNCEFSGSAQKAIDDLGSVSNHYENCKFDGAYFGIQGTDMSMLNIVGGANQFNNIYGNISSTKTKTGLTGFWINCASMTAGYYDYCDNFHGVNYVSAEPSYVLFEACTFNAVTGSHAYPLYFRGNHDINIMGGTFNPCPSKAWYVYSGTLNISDGATHNSCPAP